MQCRECGVEIAKTRKARRQGELCADCHQVNLWESQERERENPRDTIEEDERAAFNDRMEAFRNEF